MSTQPPGVNSAMLASMRGQRENNVRSSSSFPAANVEGDDEEGDGGGGGGDWGSEGLGAKAQGFGDMGFGGRMSSFFGEPGDFAWGMNFGQGGAARMDPIMGLGSIMQSFDLRGMLGGLKLTVGLGASSATSGFGFPGMQKGDQGRGG